MSVFLYDLAVQVAGGLIVWLVIKCAECAIEKYRNKHEKTANEES